MNKTVIALACAVVLGGFFVQGAEARHHHRWNNGCNNGGYNNGWNNNGRHRGWRNRGYYNSYNGYGNGWGNRYNNGYSGIGTRLLNWR